MRLDVNFIKKIFKKVDVLQGDFPEKINFSVDTRTLKEGDVFIALKGQNVDGHDFIDNECSKKASGFILNKSKRDVLKKIESSKLKNKLIILSEDSKSFLIDLAKAWRKQFKIPILAITGSVGKTTTKELMRSIITLAGKNYLITKGNQNTEIGVSLNLLRLNSSYEGAIFELGISNRAEMTELVNIVKPDYAAITAIAHAHLSGLGSLSDVAIEKRKIFGSFNESNIGVIHGDENLLSSISYRHPVIKFGKKTTNQIQARKVKITDSGISFVLKIYKEKYNIHLKTYNLGIVNNILAASALSYLVNIDNKIIVKSVQQPLSIDGRFKVSDLTIAKGKLIDDCYNANPESMKNALMALHKIPCKGKKVAVLGDMHELGVDTDFWHKQVGRFLRKALSINEVLLVGNKIKLASTTLPISTRFELCDSWQDALTYLKKSLTDNSFVLVKGSTGGYKKGLANLVKALKKENDDLNLIAARSEKLIRTKGAKVI